MRKWYQYLIPTYGRWGGPGWSGGEFVDDPRLVNWFVPPVDNMDALFKDHDEMYQKKRVTRWCADSLLLARLDGLNVKGIWANAYRYGCIVAFQIKLKTGVGYA
jgi:hypothetical protein